MKLRENKNFKLYMCFSAFVINGMLALSTGSLLPFLREARNMDYAFAGLIVSLHSVGNLISSFVSGALPTIIGRKKSILFFNSFIAISFLFILISESNLFCALAFFLTGIARGATSNFCNKEVNEIAPGQAAIINTLHAMFAIGAFSFPLILMALTFNNESNWILGCVFMLIMGLLSWSIYFMMPLENDVVSKNGKNGIMDLGFFQEPLFYLCTLTLFFYLCAEQGVIGWMITYFKDTGLLPASLSQVTASVLWIMILAGRLTTAKASKKYDKENLVLLMGLGIVAFFFMLLVSKTTPLILIGIMGFGFSMAGIYPTTVSFTSSIIQKYDIAWSFILTLASIGSIVMPSIIGKIAETMGIYYGMSSVILVVAIDLVLIITLFTYIKKLRKNGVSI